MGLLGHSSKIQAIGFLCLMHSIPAHSAQWINIPAGNFIMGSSPAQIEQAYQISVKGYGHQGVRQAAWYDAESPQKTIYLDTFRIMQNPVTQAEYAKFIHATKHKAPFVSKKQWQSYHLAHPYSHVRPYLWQQGKPPKNKPNHPVVLINLHDAQAYAQWLSKKTSKHLQLPSHARQSRQVLSLG